MGLREAIRRLLDSYSTRPENCDPSLTPIVLSPELRTRIITLYVDLASGNPHIAGGGEFAGTGIPYYREDFWAQVQKNLHTIFGTYNLSGNPLAPPEQDVLPYLQVCEPEHLLEFIEATFKTDSSWHIFGDGNSVVGIINDYLRFDEVPLQLTERVVESDPPNGGGGPPPVRRKTAAYPKVVRMDNETVHEKAIAPALNLLTDPDYASANSEFRDALDRLKKGEYRECVTYCSSACESVMKVLCRKNSWKFNEKDSISVLADTVIDNSALAPVYKQQIQNIGTVRNSRGMAHGAGDADKSVAFHVAEHTVATTAAIIVLLYRECNVS